MSVNYGRPNEQWRLWEIERESGGEGSEACNLRNESDVWECAGDTAAARARHIHSHISDHTSSIVTDVTLLWCNLGPTPLPKSHLPPLTPSLTIQTTYGSFIPVIHFTPLNIILISTHFLNIDGKMNRWPQCFSLKFSLLKRAALDIVEGDLWG